MMTRGSICRNSKWSPQAHLRSVKLYNVYRAYKAGKDHYTNYLDKLRKEYTDRYEDSILIDNEFCE